MWLVQVHRYRYVQIDMYSYEVHTYKYVQIDMYSYEVHTYRYVPIRSYSYVQVVPVPEEYQKEYQVTGKYDHDDKSANTAANFL